MSKFLKWPYLLSLSIHILDIDTHDLLWWSLSPNITFVMVQCILGEKVAFQQKILTFFKFLITLKFSEHKYREHVAYVSLLPKMVISMIECIFVWKTWLFTEKLQHFSTFLIIGFQWSHLQHMLSVGLSVSWWDIFHSRYHFWVKKCVFVTKMLLGRVLLGSDFIRYTKIPNKWIWGPIWGLCFLYIQLFLD